MRENAEQMYENPEMSRYMPQVDSSENMTVYSSSTVVSEGVIDLKKGYTHKAGWLGHLNKYRWSPS